MKKICLAISHTPWVKERVVTFERLKKQLLVTGIEGHENYGLPTIPVTNYLEMTDRAPNHEWSGRMWAWAAEQKEADYCLFLQDDVVVAPNFWRALDAMLEAIPDQIIALETAHPGGRIAWRRDEHWVSTCDGLIGVGYVFPRKRLIEFLEWRKTALQEGVLERITEDSLIDLWLMATGRFAYHPVPTIIDHDTEVPSTYGNDHHTHRRPSVTWYDLEKDGKDIALMEFKSFWMTKIPHLGRFYAESYRNLFALNDFPRDRFMTLERDLCPKAYLTTPQNRQGLKIVIATPVMGAEVSVLYNSSVYRLGATVKDAEFSLLVEYDNQGKKIDLGHALDHTWYYSRDLVRARSRIIRRFLRTDGTHLLFIDADIQFTIEAIAGLVAANEECIAAPYARKDIDWNRVRQAAKLGLDPEKFASTYAYRKLEEERATSSIVDVAGIGFGCILLSRKCLQQMVDAYKKDLTFVDDMPGEGNPETVALFQLLIDPKTRLLLGEDYSFCERWRAIGGKVKMYLGPGSPVNHVGSYAFVGHREGLTVIDGMGHPSTPAVDQ